MDYCFVHEPDEARLKELMRLYDGAPYSLSDGRRGALIPWDKLDTLFQRFLNVNYDSITESGHNGIGMLDTQLNWGDRDPAAVARVVQSEEKFRAKWGFSLSECQSQASSDYINKKMASNPVMQTTSKVVSCNAPYVASDMAYLSDVIQAKVNLPVSVYFGSSPQNFSGLSVYWSPCEPLAGKFVADEIPAPNAKYISGTKPINDASGNLIACTNSSLIRLFLVANKGIAYNPSIYDYIAEKFADIVKEECGSLDLTTIKVRELANRRAKARLSSIASELKSERSRMDTLQKDFIESCSKYNEKLGIYTDLNSGSTEYIDNIVRKVSSIAAIPEVASWRLEGDKLEFSTKMLYAFDPRTAQVRKIGEMFVSVNTSDGFIKVTNMSWTVRGCESGMQAPHVFPDGRPCLGQLGTTTGPMIAAMDYGPLVSSIITYLQSANVEDSAGKYVHRWPLANEKETEAFKEKYAHLCSMKP